MTNLHRMLRTGPLILALALASLALASCSSVTGPTASSVSLSSDPLVGKFLWHDLLTDNVDLTRQFYSAVLGWTFENTVRPGDGGPYTLIKSGGAYVGGMVHLEDPVDGNDYSRWLGYLSVDDVPRAAATALESGGNVLVEPFAVPGIGKVAGIQDPQGAVLGIVRSTVGDPDDSQPPGLGQVLWNELVTTDDTLAAEFYAGIANFTSETISRRGGSYILLNAGSITRAGILQSPVSDLPPAWITHFAVANPIAAASRAIQAGGKVLIEPSPEFRDGTLALLADPSGAMFMVQQL